MALKVPKETQALKASKESKVQPVKMVLVLTSKVLLRMKPHFQELEQLVIHI